MIRANMRMVISIARKYQHYGVPLTDLIQEGSLGLVRAVEKFDPERGFKLSTYSAWWIQQAVFKVRALGATVITSASMSTQQVSFFVRYTALALSRVSHDVFTAGSSIFSLFFIVQVIVFSCSY